MQVPLFLRQSKTWFENIADRCVPKHIHPNMITVFGFVVNLIVVVCYLVNIIRLDVFLIVYFLTQVFDVLDGAVARVRKTVTNVGRLLDTGSDLVSGVLMLCVIAYKTVLLSWVWIGILCLVYAIRWYFVYRDEDKDIGGYKNALVVGLLLAYYSEFDSTLVVQIIALFNMVVIGLNLQTRAKVSSSASLTK